MDKVISYSLYGEDPRYVINAIFNMEQAEEFYPGWQARIYYDNSVPKSIILKLAGYKNCKLVNMTNEYIPPFKFLAHSHKMFWRFYAYDDPSVSTVIFRDLDSYLSKREADAVNQWLETHKPLHLMREVQPGHRSKVMGGMWGLNKTPKIPSFLRLLEGHVKHNLPTDQNYLSTIIYPLFGPDDRVVHDQDNVFGDVTHAWPSPRINDMFIGRTQGPPNPETGYIERYEALIKELL